MEIRSFDPLWDSAQAFVLWERSIGPQYAMDAETFQAHVAACVLGRPNGACVAVQNDVVVGFALTERNGDTGFLHALLVSPGNQRRGIGSALLSRCEEQLRQEGCHALWLGRGPERLWTALPQDLAQAATFFAARGFAGQSEVCDLVIDLREQPGDRYLDRLTQSGVEVVPCTREMLPDVLAFEQREFGGWTNGILRFAAKGEEENVLVVRDPEEIVGTIQTFPPDSRTAGPNLVWRAAFPGTLGGYGAVGIAKAWRGKGLGIAMCEAAGNCLREKGADFCFIDWTTIVDFYARVGAKVWRRFAMMNKDL